MLTELDKKIAYGQAYNLAVALVAPVRVRDRFDLEPIKEEIEYWQKYFYEQLVNHKETYIDPDTLEEVVGSLSPSPNKNNKFKGGTPYCKTCKASIGNHDCDNCEYCGTGGQEKEDFKP